VLDLKKNEWKIKMKLAVILGITLGFTLLLGLFFKTESELSMVFYAMFVVILSTVTLLFWGDLGKKKTLKK